MIAGWAVILVALTYLSALFAVAHFGDTSGRRLFNGPARGSIYALAIGVYCTSWTFYGSVGLASRQGLNFLGVYVGPILVFTFGSGLLRRIVTLAKAQNSTSVADFIGARYGKSERVAAIVCLLLVIGTVPYIALQLKAISASLATILEAVDGHGYRNAPLPFGDLALFTALLLAFFTMLFGTRHIDATEHQDGLVIAIATESIVKLLAFLAVGVLIVFFVYDGFGDLISKGAPPIDLTSLIARTPSTSSWLSITLISTCAALLLPRQFHTAVVENRDPADVDRAAWAFPLYLVAINIFVVPLALAGLHYFPDGAIDRDMTVLALPLATSHSGFALIAFVGGFSAATAMVIVECVALAIMVSNHVVLPLWLRRGLIFGVVDREAQRSSAGDLGALVLIARRGAIVIVLLLGYIYYRTAGENELASIGLTSFAAVAQIAPAFIGALFWRRATSTGATAGMVVGLLIWSYTLLLPNFASVNPTISAIIESGPFGIAALKPTALLPLDVDTLTHGVIISLSFNTLFFVAGSLTRPATSLERAQANLFVGPDGAPITQGFRLRRAAITMGELQTAIARYLGEDRTKGAFEAYALERGLPPDPRVGADPHMMQFGERLLASAIGAASSRLVLSLLLRRRTSSGQGAMKLLDEASAAIEYNRDILQNALDHARQGITVFDRDMRLMCWNREFGAIFDLPPDMVRVGVGLDEIVAHNAARGVYGEGSPPEIAARRFDRFIHTAEPDRLKIYPSGRVIEIRSSKLPDGGMVATYTDISDRVEAEEALASANETLEGRVRDRTEELMRVNAELERAKGEAEEANRSKTRFLAAASHDILQPLNAARLFATSLVERDRQAGDAGLADNVDASLEAVEDIISALLEISRLDAGAMKAELSGFRLDELTRQLEREFAPLAAEKGIKLRFVHSSASVRSDRRLARRLLQNLISNAIKYTPRGGVLIGCRRGRGRIRVEVRDTGLGIPAAKQKTIFREFQRLDEGARAARGLGLGLSIVERIGRVLNAPVRVRSAVGRGSVFFFELPLTKSLPAATTASFAPPRALAPLSGMTVLAIDNEPAILEGMRALLEGWGCAVITASGSKDAASALKEPHAPLNALIVDYHLDDENGVDVAMRLRWREGRGLPVVMLTADRSPEVRDLAIEKGIHVLQKPLRPAALRALLAQWQATQAAAE
ncbi:PAS domain-containing hybrid sensor histidine kinase/response regulator [Terrarubrum flagellatum]|uniref:PAS domain-containing hybrid sensor histidine kinase/response regulator n=1 Tax=Terrirubrum flagellatum TaxID=2895980 RepID=UPI00314522B6